MSMPPELAEALRGNAAAAAAFDRLPPSHQREYTRWIEQAKQEKTRAGRAAKTVEMLLGAGREGGE